MLSMQIKNWPISARLAILVAFGVLAVMLAAGFMLYAKRETMMGAKRDQTRNLVEVAHGIVAGMHALEASGELRRDEAQTRAKTLLRKLRYEESEYFWVNDLHPRMVMHPIKPELDGQDLTDNADPKGKKLFLAFVDEVKRSGAGFVDYMWPKPGVTEPVDKVSYVKGFAPWGWIIGSGIYVDDVDAKFWQETRAFAFALALGGALCFLLAWGLTRSITRPLALAAEVADAMAAGDLSRKIEVTSRDETGRLLHSMQKMAETLKAFYAAQIEMKQQHDAGTISYRIPIEQFAGRYREMAAMTNELVGAHIALKMKIVEVVSRYALGDLSLDMDRLPGEKAKITVAVDGVKASLQSINGEIAKLVEAALKGDFTVRGDADKYQHDFRKMVEGLNRLMQVSDTGLAEVVRVLGALARGDLTEKITNDYQGTFGRLKDDSNTTVDKLTEIITRIKEATESINVASKEIASGNTDLSSRTEEQASSLEETASSMEELTSTVKQNAENARQANQLAAGASEVAVKGGSVVGQVVTTMSSINESSKKIVDIISVIDGIAFQTNILALNAAVEAARAGEQGRGFAVVATEVRTLAQRSAAAAKEIKALIGDSVEKVGAGTKLVDEAGKTMQEIVVSVKRVTDIMVEITAASQEQSAGIEQVNTAITQMDEVTQQNAALVEEAAAGAESLEEQAQNLAKSVALFRLERGIIALDEKFDFEKAANAHADWKHRLYACVDGTGEALDAAIVSSDNRCVLGGWIYGGGKPFAKYGEYDALRSAHASFHRCAGNVVRLAQAGQCEEAKRALEREFAAESKTTIDRLYAMKAVAQRAPAPARGRVGVAARREPAGVFASRIPAKATPLRASKARASTASGGGDEWTEF